MQCTLKNNIFSSMFISCDKYEKKSERNLMSGWKVMIHYLTRQYKAVFLLFSKCGRFSWFCSVYFKNIFFYQYSSHKTSIEKNMSEISRLVAKLQLFKVKQWHVLQGVAKFWGILTFEYLPERYIYIYIYISLW